MRILSFLTRYSRGFLALGILASLASGAVYSTLIALINFTVERATPPTRPDIVLFLVLLVLFPVVRTAAQVLLAQLGQRALADLRVRMAKRILQAPLRSLEELGGGRLLATLADDTVTISAAFGGLALILMHLGIVLGCLVLLATISLPLFAGVVVFVVVAVLAYRYGLDRALRFLGQARETQDRLYRYLRSLTDGLKELKLNRERQDHFVGALLEPTSHQYATQQVSAAVRLGISGSWVTFVYFLLIGLLFVLGPQELGTPMSVVIQTVLTLMFMAISIDVVSQLMPALGRATVALNKVEKLGISLDQLALPAPRQLPASTTAGWQALELAGVTHAYHRERENDSFTLGPIDLRFRRGELVFLVGGNGSGKTTLAKLLTGLYVPEAGEIRLDGVAIDDAGREAYGQLFSCVFSDFHLFEHLVGEHHADLEGQARSYLEKLHLDHKVRVEAATLSATTSLSQGQQKRLALLAAYLEDRPIYLFDEWAADQDPEFKEVFYRRLLPELKARGKTVFVISHDDRYYDVADRVVKLNYGQVERDTAPSSLPAAGAAARELAALEVAPGARLS